MRMWQAVFLVEGTPTDINSHERYVVKILKKKKKKKKPPPDH